jgi:ribulose-phosphate 3-epimerase
MYKNISLTASIMCIDWLNASNQIRELESEFIDYIHYDIVDGVFAPDFTMGSSIINSIRSQTKLKSDYHLMIEEPSRIFDMFIPHKDSIIYIHQESCRNLHRDLINLKRRGFKIGVALCPATSLETLEYILQDINYILLMTVNPGYKGQELVQQTIRKISNLKKIINEMDLDIKITVDGNVNEKTIPEMIAAGSDKLVLGSSGLFRADRTIKESLIILKNAIDSGLNKKRNV